MPAAATITEPDELAAARGRVEALHEELRTLDERTTAARRAADVAEWMALQNRADDLPEEIRAATVALLPLELEQAWQAAEQAVEVEAGREAEWRRRQAELEDLHVDKQLPVRSLEEAWRVRTPEAMAALEVKQAAKAAERAAAEQAWDTARGVTDNALADVEDIESKMEAVGLQVPDGAGLRARPRPLRRTVGTSLHPSMATRIGEPTGGPRSLTVLAGQVPPRWAARRIGGSNFQPDAERSA